MLDSSPESELSSGLGPNNVRPSARNGWLLAISPSTMMQRWWMMPVCRVVRFSTMMDDVPWQRQEDQVMLCTACRYSTVMIAYIFLKTLHAWYWKLLAWRYRRYRNVEMGMITLTTMGGQSTCQHVKMVGFNMPPTAFRLGSLISSPLSLGHA